MQGDDAERLRDAVRKRGRSRRRARGCRGSCSSPCRRRHPAEVRRRPWPRRVVDAGEPRRHPAIELLRERVPQVVAAQPGLDVRDGRRGAARPIAAPSTVVIVSPWTSTSGLPGPARAAVGASARRARTIATPSRASPVCRAFVRGRGRRTRARARGPGCGVRTARETPGSASPADRWSRGGSGARARSSRSEHRARA